MLDDRLGCSSGWKIPIFGIRIELGIGEMITVPAKLWRDDLDLILNYDYLILLCQWTKYSLKPLTLVLSTFSFLVLVETWFIKINKIKLFHIYITSIYLPYVLPFTLQLAQPAHHLLLIHVFHYPLQLLHHFGVQSLCLFMNLSLILGDVQVIF